MSFQFSNPQAIAEAGEKIYDKKYRADFEARHPGKFVAIDVLSEKAYIGESPEEALNTAREDAPRAVFHLIKVGSLGAFRVSYSSNASADWLYK